MYGFLPSMYENETEMYDDFRTPWELYEYGKTVPYTRTVQNGTVR